MKRFYKNGYLVLENSVEATGLLTENGLITALCDDARADEVIDLQGRYLAPGFIDTHVHGGAGCDVMDATPKALDKIARFHAEHGCTGFLATTLTGPIPAITAAVKNAAAFMRAQTQGARVLGVHLEGPCLAFKYKGAQNPQYLQKPSPVLFDTLDAGLGVVKRVSMAPELPMAMETAAYLSGQGICVSIAHSAADFDTVQEAAQNGFSHVTHICNGSSHLTSPDYYCRAGVVEAGLYFDTLTAEIIADGRHQPPGIMKLLYKCKGRDGMLLTTDCTRPGGMSPGIYELGGLEVLVEDEVAMLSDRSSFAGSIAGCDRLVRYAYRQCGIPLHETVKMASLNHARLIGLDDVIGSIRIGKRADLISFDDNIDLYPLS